MSTKAMMIRKINSILRPGQELDPEALGLHRLSNPQLFQLLEAVENLSNKELSS